jgi:hypothetical protein
MSKSSCILDSLRSVEGVKDFVTDSAIDEDGSEGIGKGPGDGKGSSHGSKTRAFVMGIDP